MVIQSLGFSDLWCCFLLQHFFAKLQDKVDQKHFVESNITEIIDYSMLMLMLIQQLPKESNGLPCLWMSLISLHPFPKNVSSF